MHRATEELPEALPSNWQTGGGEPVSAAPRNNAGKGPKNYRRSDSRIHEDVCELLCKNADIDASGIEVSVGEGCVILRGVVDSPWTKHEAETVVSHSAGVRAVINELRTQRAD